MAGVFRPGDIVRLKSGGPLMTVRESYERTQTVFTNWFDGDTLMYDSFFAVELERGYLPASGLGPAPFGPPANLPFIQRADFPFVQPVPGTASGWPIGEPIPGTAAGSSVSTTGQLQKVESEPRPLPLAIADVEGLGLVEFFAAEHYFYVVIEGKGCVYAKYDPTFPNNFDFGAVRV